MTSRPSFAMGSTTLEMDSVSVSIASSVAMSSSIEGTVTVLSDDAACSLTHEVSTFSASGDRHSASGRLLQVFHH
jgi:hypothetical protein